MTPSCPGTRTCWPSTRACGAAPPPRAGPSRGSAWCGRRDPPGRRADSEDPPVGPRPPEGGPETGARRGELAGTDAGRLVLVDGTGIDARMARACARAERGPRAMGASCRRGRPTVLGASAPAGMRVESRSAAAAAGAAVFSAFAAAVPVPVRRVAGPTRPCSRATSPRAGMRRALSAAPSGPGRSARTPGLGPVQPGPGLPPYSPP